MLLKNNACEKTLPGFWPFHYSGERLWRLRCVMGNDSTHMTHLNKISLHKINSGLKKAHQTWVYFHILVISSSLTNDNIPLQYTTVADESFWPYHHS
jgi:hypothetical protein